MSQVFFSYMPLKVNTLIQRCSLKNVEKVILIYDRQLRNTLAFRAWSEPFQDSIAVRSGESLKTLESYAQTLEKLLPMVRGYNRNQILLLAAGGGSVGDFVGFIASTLKRGVHLIHVPTTWLAALDSSHGGKTALNFGPFKNQIGSFYTASGVMVSQQFLRSQPPENERSAWGELLKMAWICGGELYRKASQERRSLWTLLPLAVKGKTRVVQSDYKEQGLRKVLNFGHTLGHVFEAHWRWPHGEAVAYGMLFSLKWSQELGILKAGQIEPLMRQWEACGYSELRLRRQLRRQPLSPSELRNYLLQDKKGQSGHELDFVFLQALGRVQVSRVPVDSIVEAFFSLWGRQSRI